LLKIALDALPDDSVVSSRSICEALGRELTNRGATRAILKSAVEREVPVYVPAFTDSELGLDSAIYNRLRVASGVAARPFDPFLDLDDFANRVREHENLGIFTIGGGAPQN
jgi:deoxyhypusine synthase